MQSAEWRPVFPKLLADIKAQQSAEVTPKHQSEDIREDLPTEITHKECPHSHVRKSNADASETGDVLTSWQTALRVCWMSMTLAAHIASSMRGRAASSSFWRSLGHLDLCLSPSPLQLHPALFPLLGLQGRILWELASRLQIIASRMQPLAIGADRLSGCRGGALPDTTHKRTRRHKCACLPGGAELQLWILPMVHGPGQEPELSAPSRDAITLTPTRS